MAKPNKLYVNEGTRATPSLTEVPRAIDVGWNSNFAEFSVDRRESDREMIDVSHTGLEITFGYRYKTGTDAVYDLFETAADGLSVIDLWVLDGDSGTSGVRGVRAPCKLTGFNKSEPLKDADVIEVTAKPTDHEESSALVEWDYYIVP